ncbi:SDR family NAD(P)-dependent oxidoreductase [Streptomyces sp. NPDC053048]|uniref:SDR family NAD(P)-dependent oxidoreductase n=1 Tax=Streptomyces sp. NPDC053048 TaxID=3365694 RepID=UPI0037CEE35C
MATARAALLAAGANTDWSRYFPRPGRVTELPAYPWQREHHWTVPKEQAGSPPVLHPLLGSRVPAPFPLWAGAVEPALVPWLADHRIAGSVVMPATGYVEMALAAGRLVWDAPVEVEHLDITSALAVNWAYASAVKVQVSLDRDDGLLQVSSADGHTGEPRPLARARVRTLLASRPGPLDLKALRERCMRRVKAEDHYATCTAAGLDHGPAFRVLTDLNTGDKEALAHYSHPAPGTPYTAHPALLDGALQAGAPLLADLVARGQAYLPAAISAVRVWATPSASGVIAVRERSRTDSEICWDIALADPDGTLTAQLDGCRLCRFAGTRTTPLSITHTVLRAAPRDDAPSSAPSPVPLPAQVVTACAPRIVEARTAWKELDYDGGGAQAVLAPRTREEWDAGLTTAGEVSPTVVLLLGEAADDPNTVMAQTADRAEILRSCACALETRQEGNCRPELCVVTRPSGAVEVGLDIEQPTDAAVWAMARSMANEWPGTRFRRVSLTRAGDLDRNARRLAQELCTPGDEDEIVLTAQGRFVPREQHRPSARPATDGRPYTIRVRNPGLSYQLSWQETVRPEPGPGEVLVEVRATALNYRDIMRVTGLLPAEASEGIPFADGFRMECAGLVVTCGEGVTQLKPGDRIACMAAAALGSYALARSEAAVRLPDDTTFTESATLPVAYATVLYSLGTLARLQPGETVLIHGAAGGVGLAALRYATARGANVIATAGSDIKRNFLEFLGVRHVLDSRSLDFADQIRSITQGRGVDVVLNSLAGEAMPRSLELLRPGGRFLELGKRDFYENKPLLLRPFKNNIAFFGVDLTRVIADERQLAGLLAQLEDPALHDVVRPLPHSVFPAARVDEAFAFLQHSRHIGKVVVAFDPLDEPPLVEPRVQTPRLDPAGTYLVTGGTSGFGAETAKWLAGLGARHLALVSRRGPDAPEAESVLTALRQQGVQATAYATDAADLTAMTELVARIDAQGHPLRGVVHAADAPQRRRGHRRALGHYRITPSPRPGTQRRGGPSGRTRGGIHPTALPERPGHRPEATGRHLKPIPRRHRTAHDRITTACPGLRNRPESPLPRTWCPRLGKSGQSRLLHPADHAAPPRRPVVVPERPGHSLPQPAGHQAG